MSRYAVAVALLLVVVGCTLPGSSEPSSEGAESGGTSQPSDSDDDASAPQSTTSMPAPPDEGSGPGFDSGTGDLAELLNPGDHIVVQTAGNDLVVLSAAGPLAGPTDGDANQPVFSPDGSALAWSSLDDPSGQATVVIADVGADGAISNEVRIDTPLLSFYTVWAPGSSDRLAILGNSTRGVGVAVVDRATGASEVLDQGVPYYFLWNQQADGFIGHVDTTLHTLDIETEVETDDLQVLPTFRVPAVLADGSAVYVAVPSLIGEGASALTRVSADPAGGFDPDTATPVATFNGLAALVPSPDTDRIAVVVEGDIDSVQTVTNRQGTALGRGLHLLDTGSDEVTTLVSEPVLAAFWSPDGERLATLQFAEPVDGNVRVKWTVVDLEGVVVSETPGFVLSRIFAGAYLPFYDQYAQSISIWSPDSSRIVFTGDSDDGRSGVWLHSLPGTDSEASTAYLGAGVVAMFSPAAAR